MSKASSQAVELYGVSPDELEILYERGCTYYIELYNAEGCPPRMAEVAGRILESHPGEYPSAEYVISRLAHPDFQQELSARRKENLVATIGPRLLMAEMAASIARDALDEMLARLRDPQRREGISNRDLNSLVKTAAELASTADREVEEVAAASNVNKGTVVNLFTQLSPERATVVLQEMVRHAKAKERNDA